MYKQVGWDESIAGEKRNRVSIWEIEPITAPFFLCPTPPIFGSKRPRLPGMLGEQVDLEMRDTPLKINLELHTHVETDDLTLSCFSSSR